MKKYLNYRKKLHICRAYLISAIENFLSSKINYIFSDSLVAEFVVKISSFDLHQRDLSHCAINSSLFMYPYNPKKYKVPKDFIGYDGAIEMNSVRITLQSKNKNDRWFSKKNSLEGFDKNTIRLLFEVLHEDGIDVVSQKIREVQSVFGCYKKSGQEGEYIDVIYESNVFLMQCMCELIEQLDPEFFFSHEFEKLKMWLLSDQPEKIQYRDSPIGVTS